MDQPVRTFTLVGLVVFFLLLMHQLPTVSIGGTELRHVNLLSQIQPDVHESVVDVIPVPKAPKSVIAVAAKGRVVEFKEKWPKGVEPISDFSEGKAGGMDFFYAQLARLKQLDRPVRIAYFGDSFIEGDILTGDLRALFQDRFGGSGVGWVDCSMPVAVVRRTVNLKSNGIAGFATVKKPFDKGRQGFSQRYFVPSEGASVTARGSKSQPHVGSWQHANLFFRTPQAIEINVEAGNMPAYRYQTRASDGVQMLTTKGEMGAVSYRFTQVSPQTTLFGIALESGKGVILLILHICAPTTSSSCISDSMKLLRAIRFHC